MESAIARRRVLYDLTRLIERRNAETATGLDRVDLHYARFVSQGNLGAAEFVAQQGGALARIDSAIAERLLEILDRRWLSGEQIGLPRGIERMCASATEDTFGSNETKAASRRDETARYLRRMPLDRRLQVAKRIYFGGALPNELGWIKQVPFFRRLFVVAPAFASRKLLRRLAEVRPHRSSRDARVQSKEVSSNPSVPSSVKEMDHVVYVNASGNGRLKIDSLTDLFVASELEIIVFVHDLIPIHYPEYVRDSEAIIHKERVDTILTLQAKLVVNSRVTRGSMLGLCAERGVQPPDMQVAYIGADEIRKDSNMVGAETPSRRYFVCVGPIAPGKNHLLLLTIWRRLVDELGDGAPLLVIIGEREPGNQNVFDFLDRCKKLRGHVIELGAVADAHMHELIIGARCLLCPAFVEGGGLQVVEALGSGVPVIASDLPILREVGQGVPDYIDPNDGVGWENAVKEYTQDDSCLRRGQLERLSRFKGPTWEEHFSAVKEFVTKQPVPSEEGAGTLSVSEE